jgi:translation elongation factor EF-1beta
LITVIVEDREGGTEALEASLSVIEEVESIQVVAITRML